MNIINIQKQQTAPYRTAPYNVLLTGQLKFAWFTNTAGEQQRPPIILASYLQSRRTMRGIKVTPKEEHETCPVAPAPSSVPLYLQT